MIDDVQTIKRYAGPWDKRIVDSIYMQLAASELERLPGDYLERQEGFLKISNDRRRDL